MILYSGKEVFSNLFSRIAKIIGFLYPTVIIIRSNRVYWMSGHGVLTVNYNRLKKRFL